MVKKIDGYFDCVSLYSYFAVQFLFKRKDELERQGVQLNFLPVFLSGIVQASGNTPPWKLERRAKYLVYDRKRAMQHFGTPDLKIPTQFPPNTLMLQRCLAFVQATFPKAKFEASLFQCMKAMWEEQVILDKPDTLSRVFGRTFGESEVQSIIEAAGQAEWKAKLTERTKDALDKGAYGAPWFWVTNDQGEEEPFFGSDRFNYIWRFLGLEWEDMKLGSSLTSKL